jgi:hypothetical protein
VNVNDFEIVLLRDTRGGLVRVTRIAPAEGALETWLANAGDAESAVLDQWGDIHALALGYRPAWQPESPIHRLRRKPGISADL